MSRLSIVKSNAVFFHYGAFKIVLNKRDAVVVYACLLCQVGNRFFFFWWLSITMSIMFNLMKLLLRIKRVSSYTIQVGKKFGGCEG